MCALPKIWFLRHGETEWNAEGRIQGQLESDLTARGRQHAEHQALILAKTLNAAPPCFVSPLRRARHTADIALNGMPYSIDQRLAEAFAGAGQGLTRAEIEERWPGTLAKHTTALELFCGLPQAEGFEAFQARITDFLNGLTEPSVIVAHGLLGQVVRGTVTGLSRADMGLLPNEQGCVYVLEDGQERVVRLEDVDAKKATDPLVF